jgi:glutaredoxin|tara:strand:- start:30 stop:317 length:288 start_codon:yes stop_codon:yes gene_type:complete
MDKIAVIFTMKGCPHCIILKEMLEKDEIDYIDRDINDYEEEYDMFVEATGNDFVPAFMLIENPESEKPNTGLYAPDRDFEDVEHGLKIIKEFFER